MPFPKTCPKCEADLTVDGAVEQRATELGDWSARVDENGDFEFGEFTTRETDCVEYTRCSECKEDIDEIEEDYANVWAVTHVFGVSIYRSLTKEGALAYARREFGSTGEPYSASQSAEEIDFALAMGAGIFGDPKAEK